jgi:hypothetical protein
MIATKIPNLKRLIVTIMTPIEKILKTIAEKINLVPKKEETEKARQRMKQISDYGRNEGRVNNKIKKPLKKEIYSFKGSGHNGKGKVNREAKTFNHPRKGLPQGRSH